MPRAPPVISATLSAIASGPRTGAHHASPARIEVALDLARRGLLELLVPHREARDALEGREVLAAFLHFLAQDLLDARVVDGAVLLDPLADEGLDVRDDDRLHIDLLV